jgi:signal transduction histidine kinase
MATHLFCIAQEAVTNAVKHAQADVINIVLRRADGFIAVHVRDNGIGIKEVREPSQGMGLRIMSYRCNLIGGTFNIERLDVGGTEVVCSVPAQPNG